jgi:adenylate cyclase class 2
MSIEIELKARVEDPQALKERLSRLAVAEAMAEASAFAKDDCYWTRSGEGLPLPAVRVRRDLLTGSGGDEGGKALVTCKIKEVRDGIEINDEREFTVSGAAAFEDLLRRLGLEPETRKHKQGWAWFVGSIHAELCEVSGEKRSLGWFLEIEIIEEAAEAPAVAAAREKLLGFLDTLAIPRSRIEDRFYSDLLA